MNSIFFKIKVFIVMITSVLSLNLVYAQGNIEGQNNAKDVSGLQKIKLGELDIFILSDGFLRYNGIEGYSPRADLQQLKKILKENFRPTDYMDMAMNIPLVKTKERLILIDAGMGIFADKNSGALLNSLQKAGFKPEQITDIFISHAHIDHIGGLIDKNDSIVFPNARYHIAQKEFDFWMNATEGDFRNSYMFKNTKAIQFDIDAAKRIFNVIRHKVTYFDFEKPLYGNFKFQLVPGHTPGMTFITIYSDNKELTYIADQAHSDVLLFPHPEWGFFADVDLEVAIASRKKMNGQLAQSHVNILGYHLPYPGLGNIRRENRKYQWKPIGIFTPKEIKF